MRSGWATSFRGMARRRQQQPIEKRLGARLAVERERQGMSQAELARRSGVSQSSVARIEDGSRSPTIGMLEKLAHGLGLELKDLVEELGVRPTQPRAEQAFYRLCDKLREQDAGFLKAVEHLVKALEEAI